MPSDSYQGVHRLLGVAMGREGDHVLAISDLAQPTAFAGHVIRHSGRAAKHGPAGLGLPGAASLGRRHYSDCRQIVGRHHGIGNVGILSADVDGEAILFGEFQRLNVLSVEGVVSVGEAPLALVGEGECHHGNSIDDTISVRQVARHVMAPQLPFGEFADRSGQRIPVATTLAIGHCLPMNVLGTAFGVATLGLEGAGIGAGLLGARGGRDGASLAVGRLGGERDLSGGHLSMAVDVAIIQGRLVIQPALGQSFSCPPDLLGQLGEGRVFHQALVVFFYFSQQFFGRIHTQILAKCIEYKLLHGLHVHAVHNTFSIDFIQGRGILCPNFSVVHDQIRKKDLADLMM